MEFGRGYYRNLSEKYFELPEKKARFLSGKRFHSPKIYYGLPKWGRKEWIGKLYPEGTRDAQFLENYVQHFNSIELNATHYQIFGPEAISKWAAKAKGLDFKFCPKVANSISHYSGLNNVEKLTTDFLDGVRAFGENLGPIFLQMSEKYKPDKRDKLYNYLRTLPADLGFYFEARHPDWFFDRIILNELVDTLHSLDIGLVIIDTIARRDIVHMELTKPEVFIRFNCEGRHPMDYYRLGLWKKKIAEWFNEGLETCYFFLHTHDEDSMVEISTHAQKELNSILSKD